jgi:hypothetical protein
MPCAPGVTFLIACKHASTVSVKLRRSTKLGVVSVPERLQLRVPERCVECGAAGAVRFESTIQADSVILTWCCAACSHQWPVAPDDRQRPERRVGVKERRRLTRTDRRRKG